jgi:hypothetical protein
MSAGAVPLSWRACKPELLSRLESFELTLMRLYAGAGVTELYRIRKAVQQIKALVSQFRMKFSVLSALRLPLSCCCYIALTFNAIALAHGLL